MTIDLQNRIWRDLDQCNLGKTVRNQNGPFFLYRKKRTASRWACYYSQLVCTDMIFLNSTASFMSFSPVRTELPQIRFHLHRNFVFPPKSMVSRATRGKTLLAPLVHKINGVCTELT